MIVALAAQPVSAEKPREAILMAYESNPRLAAANARHDAIAERRDQARAEGLPILVVEAKADDDALTTVTQRLSI